MVDMGGELRILKRLDDELRRPEVRVHLDAIALELVPRLKDDAGAPMAWQTVPLSIYGDAIPDDVRSSWVFVLRAGVATGAERHPNSRQRMMSWRGTGDFPTKVELADPWRANRLTSDPDAPLETRWVSIPPDTWHQGVVDPAEDWVVVSFQTAAAHELIEERPSCEDPRATIKRHYVEPQD